MNAFLRLYLLTNPAAKTASRAAVVCLLLLVNPHFARSVGRYLVGGVLRLRIDPAALRFECKESDVLKIDFIQVLQSNDRVSPGLVRLRRQSNQL